MRPETGSCVQLELLVPLHIPLNLVSVGLISSGRSLCVPFLALCAEIWSQDHIICICTMQLPFAFSFCVWSAALAVVGTQWAGLQGWCGSGVLDAHQSNCSTTREHLAALQPSRALLFCQCDWSDLCSEWEIESNSICSKVGRGLGSCYINQESLQGVVSFPKRLLEILLKCWAVLVLLTLLLAYLSSSSSIWCCDFLDHVHQFFSLNWQILHWIAHTW